MHLLPALETKLGQEIVYLKEHFVGLDIVNEVLRFHVGCRKCSDLFPSAGPPSVSQEDFMAYNDRGVALRDVATNTKFLGDR